MLLSWVLSADGYAIEKRALLRQRKGISLQRGCIPDEVQQLPRETIKRTLSTQSRIRGPGGAHTVQFIAQNRHDLAQAATARYQRTTNTLRFVLIWGK